MAIMKWKILPHDSGAALKSAERMGIPPLLAILLQTRGMTEDDESKGFLSTDTRFSDPLLIPGMEAAAGRINAALDSFEKIAVYGDYDADGITATAMLYSYIESCGGNVIYYIPDRESEGYGMNTGAVDKLKEQGVNLIVTVDNGITSVEEIAYAKSLGIETVVTDHHRPREVLPQAYAVADPYIKGAGCPFKDFAGVGVAFKLIMALEGSDCDVTSLLENYADLAAIGTIGDIVELRGENRMLVREGLRFMGRTDRLGLKAVMEAAGIDPGSVTARGVLFGIVPRINAAGRIGSPDRAVRMMISEDPEEAGALAAEICEDNDYRRGIEEEIYNDVIDILDKNPGFTYDRVIVAGGRDWHPGVIGIVASRVTEKLGKPCVIFSFMGGEARGSGRSVEGFSLFEAVCACKDLLTKFGGHPMAAGMSMPEENVNEFRRRINAYAASLPEPMPAPVLNIDCMVKPEKLSVDIPSYFKYLEPFGTCNPYPLFGLRSMQISDITPVGGGKHLRVSVKRGGCTVRCMRFGTTLQEFGYAAGDTVDLAVSLTAKEYNGKNTLSIVIRAMKFSDDKTSDLINGINLYEKLKRGEELTAAEAGAMLPLREDFAAVYRALKSTGGYSGPVEVFTHRVRNARISLEKLLPILDIFSECGLVRIKKSAYTYNMEIIPQSTKADLTGSATYKLLNKYKKAGGV